MQKGSTTLWRALFDCVFCAFRPLPPRPLTVLKIGNPSVSCQGKIVATSKRGKPGSVVASICTSRKYRLCDLQGFLLYLFQVILGMQAFSIDLTQIFGAGRAHGKPAA